MTLYALGHLRPQTPDDGDFFVAPGAHVIGNVRIGTGSSVWFGSTIRGDNELIKLGQSVNIQENCVLHTDPGFPMTLGDFVTVGHKAMLHGCTVGQGSLIGMGATVLNGAEIGAGTLIGANTLITEGKTIPPGVLVVGSPGKIIRHLSEDEIEGLAKTAQKYHQNQQRFREELREI